MSDRDAADNKRHNRKHSQLLRNRLNRLSRSVTQLRRNANSGASSRINDASRTNSVELIVQQA